MAGRIACLVILIAYFYTIASCLDCDSYGSQDSDVWRLCNMFGDATYLQSAYSWFDSSDPCDWTTSTITCSNDVVAEIELPASLGSYGYTINMTLWPQNLESIDFQGIIYHLCYCCVPLFFFLCSWFV